MLLTILSRKKREISEIFHGKKTNNIRIINGTIKFKIYYSCIRNGIKGKIRAHMNRIMSPFVLYHPINPIPLRNPII